ncbi:polysialyltransferase family glycosyltransferase [Rhizobium jaguaris]|uniref:polysialyltransferase family glycosyltransferase n=1 Tax=Rhizobium jaguaris TaxID=1312183 RepID=UPI0013C47013|nr:polysialyltransferase family glycosyltransferase [Rhizobium jaguaris]
MADKAAAHSFGVFSYGAIFAVRNDLIAKWPRKSLEITYQATLGRAVYGYLLERLWLHIFGAEFDTPVALAVPPEQSSPDQAGLGLEHSEAAAPTDVEPDDDIVSAQVEELRNTAETLRLEVSQLREALKTQAALDQRAIHDVALAIKNIPGVVRPKRLFISTGYFATAVAATLASQQGSGTDDYLLITIDRQGAEGNTRWAYQMYDRWASVRTVGHDAYYENNAGFSNPFNCSFDEVYSSHFHMAGFVGQKFPASRYAFFEEGLTTYSQALSVRVQDNNTRFYALSPKLARDASIVSQPVDVKLLTQLLEKSINCYSIPIFENPHNIVMLAMGFPPHVPNSRSLSFEACEPAAKMLRAAGFDVWLKPHPRAPIDDLFGKSSLAAAGVRLLETDAPLIEPVILANRPTISAVVSVYSSFLVHSYPLFGIPAFTIRSPVIDRLQAAWKSLQDSSVPDVDMLLGATPDSIPSIARSFHNASVNHAGKLNRLG